MFYRLRMAVLAAALLIALGACGINAPALNPTFVVVIPTSTLAPIVTQTQRFTATPDPTTTFIPTLAPSPTATFLPPTESSTPTITPTAPIRGVVRVDGGIVNMRVGPGATYKILGNLKAGSQVVVLYTSSDSKWTLIQLDDGSEGWLSALLVTLINPSVTVPAITTPGLTQRAQLGTAISLTQTAIGPVTPAGVVIDANAPTHRAAIDISTDVLAYCDNSGSNAVRNRQFKAGQKVVVFWSWIANTPEQIKDQLNAAQYEVKIDGQVIGDWQKFASSVAQQKDSTYIVYWFVPIGQPSVGAHKIDFKLTWTQAIFDGVTHFGPSTNNPANTGTCSFTVK